MIVTNCTRYPGVILRSILLAVIADVEKVRARDAPLDAKCRADFIRRKCRVTYVYTRNGGCSGNASLGGGRMRLRVQRGNVETVELIWLVRHEVYHLFGVEHGNMPHSVNHRSDGASVAIGERFSELVTRLGPVLTEVAEVKKPKLGTDAKRSAKLTSIEARIKSWESKARRAENALKKLRKQRVYYETALAPLRASEEICAAAKGPR